MLAPVPATSSTRFQKFEQLLVIDTNQSQFNPVAAITSIDWSVQLQSDFLFECLMEEGENTTEKQQDNNDDEEEDTQIMTTTKSKSSDDSMFDFIDEIIETDKHQQELLQKLEQAKEEQEAHYKYCNNKNNKNISKSIYSDSYKTSTRTDSYIAIGNQIGDVRIYSTSILKQIGPIFTHRLPPPSSSSMSIGATKKYMMDQKKFSPVYCVQFCYTANDNLSDDEKKSLCSNNNNHQRNTAASASKEQEEEIQNKKPQLLLAICRQATQSVTIIDVATHKVESEYLGHNLQSSSSTTSATSTTASSISSDITTPTIVHWFKSTKILASCCGNEIHFWNRFYVAQNNEQNDDVEKKNSILVAPTFKSKSRILDFRISRGDSSFSSSDSKHSNEDRFLVVAKASGHVEIYDISDVFSPIPDHIIASTLYHPSTHGINDRFLIYATIKYRFSTSGSPRQALFLKNNKYSIVNGGGKRIEVFNENNRSSNFNFKAKSHHNNWCSDHPQRNDIAISADETTVVTADDDGVRAFDLSWNNKILTDVSDEKSFFDSCSLKTTTGNYATALTFSPSNVNYVVVGYASGRICIYSRSLFLLRMHVMKIVASGGTRMKLALDQYATQQKVCDFLN